MNAVRLFFEYLYYLQHVPYQCAAWTVTAENARHVIYGGSCAQSYLMVMVHHAQAWGEWPFIR